MLYDILPNFAVAATVAKIIFRLKLRPMVLEHIMMRCSVMADLSATALKKKVTKL